MMRLALTKFIAMITSIVTSMFTATLTPQMAIMCSTNAPMMTGHQVRQGMPVVLLMLISLLWTPPAHASDKRPPGVSVTSHTRETDYTLGSIAHQTVHVLVPAGLALDIGSLPQKSRNEAIELRDVQWKLTHSPAGDHYAFSLDWQIFVAWEAVKNIPLRPLHLVFKNKQQTLNVDVPGDKVLVSTLLPPKMDDAHVQLYADAPMPTWPLKTMLLSMLGLACILFLALIYLAWVFGWIQLPQERKMPFRQAWRVLRACADHDTQSRKQALRTLTQAMDQFAGQAVTAENLNACLQQQPKLAAYAAALQALYADVQHTFFAGQAPQHSVAALCALARQLSQIELS